MEGEESIQFEEQALRHRTADEIVAYVLGQRMSDDQLADFIVHSMIFCQKCGVVTKTVTELNQARRWSREQLVHYAELLLQAKLSK